MSITSATKSMHQIIDHDLAALGRRAQPRRLDHRLTEIVAVPHRGVTDAHADPHAELLLRAAVARLDGLLHLNRTRQRLGRAVKYHHQPIAEVLDLPAGVAVKRTAQQPKVLHTQSLRRLGTNAVSHRR
jgi:hypothetical protein